MKRATTVGLCLTIIFALSALAAASAYAGEYGECVKVEKGKTGTYSNSSCTKPAVEKKANRQASTCGGKSEKPTGSSPTTLAE